MNTLTGNVLVPMSEAAAASPTRPETGSTRSRRSWLRPYLRLARADRPIGAWLLLLPCWWSAGLAAIAAGHPIPIPGMSLLFFVGAFVMRGAGCTWNDILDRDLDAQGRAHALAPDPVGPGERARGGGVPGRAGAGRACVLLQFNRFTILRRHRVARRSSAIYPLMKRVTWWPQIVLGLAFSWGALMGWAAVFGRLDAPALLLYAGSIAWVIGYDTIYAHQDREDDALIGVKSTARLFGARTRLALLVLLRARRGADRAVPAWRPAPGRCSSSAASCSARISAGRSTGSTSTIRICACGCSSRTATPD